MTITDIVLIIVAFFVYCFGLWWFAVRGFVPDFKTPIAYWKHRRGPAYRYSFATELLTAMLPRIISYHFVVFLLLALYFLLR